MIARVLVVDDNPMNLKLACVVLEAEGYAVVAAADAAAAFAAIAASPPALILLDLQMPGIDGFEVARRLKADPTTARIPIMALTAYAMREDEARARRAGCDDYARKPIDIHALPHQVRRLLGRT